MKIIALEEHYSDPKIITLNEKYSNHAIPVATAIKNKKQFCFLFFYICTITFANLRKDFLQTLKNIVIYIY